MGRAHRMRAVLLGFGGASLRLQIMTGVALAATVALVLAVFWADREPPAGTDPGEVLHVGVVEGQSVGGYLAASRDELARLTDPSAPSAGDTWALVAFQRYAAPGWLPDLLSGAQVAQVYTRVPLTGSRTAVNRIPVYRLPDDVTAGMISAAVSRERERADYQRLSRALTGDGRNEMRLRAAYESAARLAAEEAAAYRAGCECVFAAVVRGTPAALDGSRTGRGCGWWTRLPRCAGWTVPNSGRRGPRTWRRRRRIRRRRPCHPGIPALPRTPSDRYRRRSGSM